ncbi:unnamed protein product, partial [Iphiclides podalirius]
MPVPPIAQKNQTCFSLVSISCAGRGVTHATADPTGQLNQQARRQEDTVAGTGPNVDWRSRLRKIALNNVLLANNTWDVAL